MTDEKQNKPRRTNKGKTYNSKKKRNVKPGDMQGPRRQVIIDQTTLNRINEKNKLTDKERFALYAYIASPEPEARKRELAYVMSRQKPSTATGDSLYNIAWRWFKSDPVSFFIEDTENELFMSYQKRITPNIPQQQPVVNSNNDDQNEDETDLEQGSKRNNVANINSVANGTVSTGYEFMSKEDTIRQLEDMYTIAADVKTKTEILMKIADLQQFKKEQTKQEEDQVRYYLPLKCSQCKLYNTAKRS